MGSATAAVLFDEATPKASAPVYHGWQQVPEGIATRTQLLREGLVVSAARIPFPDGYCKTRASTYPLYSRAWAIPREVKRHAKDYASIFTERYTPLAGREPIYKAALRDACEAMWDLNRFTKHDACSARERERIYDLKNRLLARLFQDGYCTVAVISYTPRKELACWDCGGKGMGWYDEEDDAYHANDECPKCGGTGVYRTVGSKPYWALRYVVAGWTYRWHQPVSLAPWARAIGEPTEDDTHEVVTSIAPVLLPRRKFAEAKALIAWVCEQADVWDVPF